MNLDRFEALKMVLRESGGNSYLLVESGGFSTKRPLDWNCTWYVLESTSAREASLEAEEGE